MLWLYNKHEREFDYNGLALSESYDADIERDLKGLHRLKFKYPVSDTYKYTFIKPNSIIKADEHNRTNLFRVKYVDNTDTDGFLEITAYQITIDYAQKIVKPFKIGGGCQYVLDRLYENMLEHDDLLTYEGKSIESHDYDTGDGFHKSKDVLNDIINLFDSEVDLHDFTIKLKARIGKDTEEVLTTSKNIVDFSSETDSTDIITRLIVSTTLEKPKGKDRTIAIGDIEAEYDEKLKQDYLEKETSRQYDNEQAEESMYYSMQLQGLPVEAKRFKGLEEIKTGVLRGYEQAKKSAKRTSEILENENTRLTLIMESPLINEYPFINEISLEAKECKSFNELEEFALKQFIVNNIDKPKRSIRVKYEQLNEDVHLGDSVILKHTKHALDERVRVVTTHWNPMTCKYTELIIGQPVSDFKSSFASAVGSRISDLFDNNADDIEPLRKLLELQRANFDRLFNDEWTKIDEAIQDGLDQATAEAETKKQEIEAEIDEKLKPLTENMDEVINNFMANSDLPTDNDIKTLEERLNDVQTDLDFVIQLLGEDEGGFKYNRNRLDGEYLERLVEIENEDGTLIEHNGQGFEVGEIYTISFETECVPRKEQVVTFNFATN